MVFQKLKACEVIGMSFFQWVAKAKSANFEMRQTWQYIQQLRSKIGDMLEVNNEGVRFYSVKFLECIITTLMYGSQVRRPHIANEIVQSDAVFVIDTSLSVSGH